MGLLLVYQAKKKEPFAKILETLSVGFRNFEIESRDLFWFDKKYQNCVGTVTQNIGPNFETVILFQTVKYVHMQNIFLNNKKTFLQLINNTLKMSSWSEHGPKGFHFHSYL